MKGDAVSLIYCTTSTCPMFEVTMTNTLPAEVTVDLISCGGCTLHSIVTAAPGFVGRRDPAAPPAPPG